MKNKKDILTRLSLLVASTAILVGCTAPIERHPVLVIPTPSAPRTPNPTPEPILDSPLPTCRVTFVTSETLKDDDQVIKDYFIPLFRLTPPQGSTDVSTSLSSHSSLTETGATIRYTLNQDIYTVGFNRSCRLTGIVIQASPPTSSSSQ